jgi:hypothetical protein
VYSYGDRMRADSITNQKRKESINRLKEEKQERNQLRCTSGGLQPLWCAPDEDSSESTTSRVPQAQPRNAAPWGPTNRKRRPQGTAFVGRAQEDSNLRPSA